MSATPQFERIAVLGLGLLGGSLAAAAKQRGVARCVVGSARRRGPLESALRDGVVDEIADARDAVSGADLVVLATPVGTMPAVVQDVAPYLAKNAIVSDVGSVKGILTDTLPGLLPPGVVFVGAHPMAGSHDKGVEHASATLFEGACCVLTPLADTPDAAVARMRAFWSALGARVVMRDPEAHDAEVAWTSHLPHILAYAFAHALERAPDSAAELAASGFADFTRIAQSDAALWGDILAANRKAISGPLEAFVEALRELASAIERGDADSQENFLAYAREQLSRIRPVATAATSDRDRAPSGGEIPEMAAPGRGGQLEKPQNPS